jgi:putative drug exporter of the RND superfamily
VSPKVAGDTEEVVFQTSGGRLVTDPAVEARAQATLGRIARVPHVTRIGSPYGVAGAGQVSAGKTIAFATVTFDQQAETVTTAVARQLVRAAQSGDQPGLTFAVAGQVAENANPPGLGGAGFGIILAAVVLFIVFGSLFGMALPLISALASLGTATGIIELVSHVLQMPDFSAELTVLIGLGVGVDYALFIVTRHRQGLRSGQEVESSIVTAVNTSGRAVLFAGITVCIALLGMFALGVSLLNGLAVAAAIGVACTMLAALTLLPALLGGQRVIKEFGLGLAGGVLVDALLIRMAVVPAVMRLLGRANWWFPAWADRVLPQPAIEPDDPDAVASATPRPVASA